MTTKETVAEQIETIANRQLITGYFEELTPSGGAEAALRTRIERDDRYLLVCDGDEQVREVDSADYLTRTNEVLGFSFGGSYTVDEMDSYMNVPFEEVYDRATFPVAHLRNYTIRGDMQGTHVNTVLTRKIMRTLFGFDHDVYVAMLRDSGDIATRSFVETMGAERLAEYTDYLEDYSCSLCGPVCECTCSFYKLQEE